MPVLSSYFLEIALARSRDARYFGGLSFGLRLRSVDDVVLAVDPRRLVMCCLLLDHLATSFERGALLDHQRRRLNVAVNFSGAT